MEETFVPILILIVLATGFGLLVLVLTHLMGPRKPSGEKLSAYECGVAPRGSATLRLSIRFYLIAVLFVLFDIETVPLFPWAIVLRDLGLFGFVSMAIFLVILLLGYVYVWRRGALEWD